MFVDEFLLFAFNVMILNPISLSKFDQPLKRCPSDQNVAMKIHQGTGLAQTVGPRRRAGPGGTVL